MKILEIHKVIREILKKQDSCSFLDINNYKREYEKMHPETYVAVSHDNIHSAVNYYADEFWWDNKMK
jgi:hypothetical protein